MLPQSARRVAGPQGRRRCVERLRVADFPLARAARRCVCRQKDPSSSSSGANRHDDPAIPSDHQWFTVARLIEVGKNKFVSKELESKGKAGEILSETKWTEETVEKFMLPEMMAYNSKNALQGFNLLEALKHAETQHNIAPKPTTGISAKSVAGSYGRNDNPRTMEIEFLNDGTMVSYSKGEKVKEGKWKLVGKDVVHVEKKRGSREVYWIHPDGSLSHIDVIQTTSNGVELGESNPQDTFKKRKYIFSKSPQDTHKK